MPETRARDLANLAGAGATSSTVAYHETARSFTLPAGVGEANQVISSDGDGTTTWKTTLSAPEITSATSDKGVNAYDSDGDDGAVIVINGTALGSDASVLTVEISTDNFVTTVQTSTISILSTGTQIQATFNGTETNYNSINAGETVKVKVTKSNLQSAQSATLSGTVTGDPTFSTTSTTVSTHTGTLPATSLGSYGGQVAGGGDDSNTKLLLNFDRTGGTDIEDSSNTGGDGHKVTASGNAVIKASPFGDGKSAMFFDGTNDYLAVGQNSTDWQLGGGDFTIEMWLHPTVLANYKRPFTTSTSSQDRAIKAWINANGKLAINLYDGSAWNSVTSADGVIKVNTWHHLAVSYDYSATSLKVFVDGAEVASSSIGTISNTNADIFYVGYDAQSTSQPFQGYIDEVRVVKGTCVYTSDFDVPTSRLTAITNTKLLIHSNQTYDSSDSNHYVTASGAIPKSDQSKFGGSSWYFDGSDDHLEIAHNTDFDFGAGASGSTANDFTIECWFRRSTNNAYQALLGKGNDTGNTQYTDAWFIAIDNSGQPNSLKFSVNNTALAGNVFTYSTNTWYHLALVRSEDVFTFYINGTALSNTSTSTVNLNKTGVFYIGAGANAGAHELNIGGYIDDLRITKGLAVYTGNFTAPTSALTKTWDSNNLGGYANLTNIASNTDASKVKLLIHGDGAKFTDSSDGASNQTTAHNITSTGSYHSQAHGGIAPALAFPASLKKTGSAGMYFDGSTDYLEIPYNADLNYGVAGQAYSIDMWIYPTEGDASQGHSIYMQGTSSSNRTLLFYYGTDGLYFRTTEGGGNNITIQTTNGTNTPIPLHQWSHIALTRDTSGVHRIYINGKFQVKGTDNYSNNFTSNHFIGKHSYSTGSEFKGYIDCVRFQKDVVLYSGSSQEYPVTGGTNAYTLPTQIYGAYRSQDVGTIQLNASAGSGGGALDYAELSGGAALSTYGLSLSSSGAITGTLSGLDDNSNSGGVIRIRARANADDDRVTTLGGSSFTGITQNDGKAPVLFNARRYRGTGVQRDITGFGFAPDLVWVKTRNRGDSHVLYDTVRGAQIALYSNGEGAQSSPQAQELNAFNADGYSVGTNWGLNKADEPAIAWAWKAGGAPVSITGTNLTNITQSASSTSGFSITKYTGGNTTGMKFPHNLGGTPDLIIIKRITDGTRSWVVWHSGLPSATATGNLTPSVYLDSDTSLLTNTGGERQYGWIAPPTSTEILLHAGSNYHSVGHTSTEYICYAWKAVSGVSAFGSFNGNGTTDVTVTVGFQPRFVMIKNVDSAGHWIMWDSFRGFGTNAHYFKANDSIAEVTVASRGCTVTSTSFTPHHYHTNTTNEFIYMAFA